MTFPEENELTWLIDFVKISNRKLIGTLRYTLKPDDIDQYFTSKKTKK